MTFPAASAAAVSPIWFLFEVCDRSIELVRDGVLTADLEIIELGDARAVLETTLNVRAAAAPAYGK